MNNERRQNAEAFKARHRGFTKTQLQMVYEYMIRYGSITQMEAADGFWCYNLAERIRDLRQKGYNISSTRAEDGNYTIYRIEKAEEAES